MHLVTQLTWVDSLVWPKTLASGAREPRFKSVSAHVRAVAKVTLSLVEQRGAPATGGRQVCDLHSPEGLPVVAGSNPALRACIAR